MAASHITPERLHEIIRYDPATGLFTWLITKGPHMKPGMLAGTIDRGYTRIRIDNSQYWAHRLAWYWVHGEWPQYEIDHIDHDRGNNRIANLRDIPHRANNQNVIKAFRGSGTGIKNVHRTYTRVRGDKGCNYRVRFKLNGKEIVCGHFATLEEAAAVADEMRAKLHPFAHVNSRS